MQISDVHNPWRDNWRQASFRGVPFHIEVGGKTSGRRIVPKEFPKRDLPYAEDMGRRIKRFRITAYIVSYMRDVDRLYQRDYRIPRDDLIEALETEGDGELVHPTLGTLIVKNGDYEVSESRERGGMAIFNIEFFEAGVKPNNALQISTQANVNTKADAAAAAAAAALDRLLAQ